MLEIKSLFLRNRAEAARKVREKQKMRQSISKVRRGRGGGRGTK